MCVCVCGVALSSLVWHGGEQKESLLRSQRSLIADPLRFNILVLPPAASLCPSLTLQRRAKRIGQVHITCRHLTNVVLTAGKVNSMLPF